MAHSILELPIELILNIFSFASSLQDLHALSASCKYFQSTFIQNNPGQRYDAILSRTLPAFDDALRAQRASVGALQHLIQLGFDAKDIKPLLPPPGTSEVVQIPRCRFNIELKQYENIPTEPAIVKLGEHPISNAWEANRILDVHRLVTSALAFAQRPHEKEPTDWDWFVLDPVNSATPTARSNKQDFIPWTLEQEERFYRGTYRLWLFGYLFVPGCFWEPIINEQHRIRDQVRKVGSEMRFWHFEEDFYPPCMLQYPVYMQQLTSASRLNHVITLFGGFTDWLVHDGEKRGDREEKDGRLNGVYLDPEKEEAWKRGYPNGMGMFLPSEHGGRRELLLLHTMDEYLNLTFENLDYNDSRLGIKAREDFSFPEMPLTVITLSCNIFNGTCHINAWRNSGSNIMTAPIEHPNALPDPAMLLIEYGSDQPWDDLDGVPVLEFIALALCKHYQLEIRRKLLTSDNLIVAYHLSGGAVLDQDIYSVLVRHGDDGLDCRYGRELLEMREQGVFEESGVLIGSQAVA